MQNSGLRPFKGCETLQTDGIRKKLFGLCVHIYFHHRMFSFKNKNTLCPKNCEATMELFSMRVIAWYIFFHTETWTFRVHKWLKLFVYFIFGIQHAPLVMTPFQIVWSLNNVKGLQCQLPKKRGVSSKLSSVIPLLESPIAVFVQRKYQGFHSLLGSWNCINLPAHNYGLLVRFSCRARKRPY